MTRPTRTATRVPTRGAARLLAPALAGGLLALAPATAASAAPTAAAPAGLVGAVTAAVRTSPETAAVPAASYAVTDVRAAAADPAWAAAVLEGRDLDPATVVLHRAGGTWRVVSLGTAGAGCEETTPAVQRDLRLDC